jgi:hypothetical protein
MALHGPIGVTLVGGGNKVIGYWEARRTVDLEDHEQLSVYACEVRLNDDPPQEFEVEHRYSDGAVALMAKVFSMASRNGDDE